jgi:Zn-dependent protease
MFQFSFLSFPVRIHWTFGLMALFVGGGFRLTGPDADWARVLVAVAVIFVSILAHEIGHALAGKRFGAKPHILLHSMGGLCYLPGGRFSREQSIIVSLAGPAAGFTLALFTWLALQGFAPQMPLVRYALATSLYINIVWTFLNLMPVLPLDGGQVLREVLGPSRAATTRLVGVIAAVLLSATAVYFGLYIAAAIAAVLGFLNFRGKAPLEGGVVTEPRPPSHATEPRPSAR